MDLVFRKIIEQLNHLPFDNGTTLFIPLNVVGDHQIMVSYCDQPVKGGPFSCKAYDAGQVIVKHMPSLASINQPVSFNSKSMYLIVFKLANMVIFKKSCSIK